MLSLENSFVASMLEPNSVDWTNIKAEINIGAGQIQLGKDDA